MLKNKKRKYIILFIVLISIIFLVIFINKTAKNSKIGKNSTSQEIVNYILNINSYQSEIEVEVKSNKNTNKYKINQIYVNDEKNIQEVIEPENIKGIKIIKEKNKIKIENTRLNLTKVIEDYKDITQNKIDLENFIKDFKNNTNSKYKQENNMIIMETSTNIKNEYQKYENLYINKDTAKPEKMEILDTNKNTTIYIKYNKININNIDNENIYAFKIYDTSKNI